MVEMRVGTPPVPPFREEICVTKTMKTNGMRNMEWYNGAEKPPTQKDSPILAYHKDFPGSPGFGAVLRWDREGWCDQGAWYDHTEYSLNTEDIGWWTHLPLPTKEWDEPGQSD
jgi:hypothetical protein